MIGTSDQGKELELACTNCTVFRISTDAAELISRNGDSRRSMYSLLARQCPFDHAIVTGTAASGVRHECVAIKRLKLLKVHWR